MELGDYMQRKEGFIDLEKILKEIGVDTSSFESIYHSDKVKHFSTPMSLFLVFNYNKEEYYFKNNEFFSPYSEMIVSELLNDFNINHVEYDLASLKEYKGLLSRSFRKKDANYIKGSELLMEYSGEVDKYMLEDYNNLEDIWMAIYERYKDNNITKKLVDQIIDLYIFDAVICNHDRHSFNFEIEEYKGDVNLAPVYDNERFLMTDHISLNVDNSKQNLYESIEYFINTSSSEYLDRVKDKLWIISDENILKAYNRIEEKTGAKIPDEMKSGYLEKFRAHREKLEEIIDKCTRMR